MQVRLLSDVIIGVLYSTAQLLDILLAVLVILLALHYLGLTVHVVRKHLGLAVLPQYLTVVRILLPQRLQTHIHYCAAHLNDSSLIRFYLQLVLYLDQCSKL